MTDSSKQTEQTQSSKTDPWAPAQGLLQTLIGQYGSQNTGVTGGQSGALSNLQQAAAGLPNFGGAGTDLVNKLFGSDSSAGVGMLNNAYNTLQTNLGATASGANLNPYSTPGFSDAINTAIQDATDKTKGVYAASGRDPSGAGSFAGSLSRGITQGIAPTIANQFNQNYGNMTAANNALFTGAGSTASGINNLRQSDFTNMLAGLNGAGAVNNLFLQPATSQLAAANAAYSQPFQNLAQLLQPSVALAGLGSTSSGQGSATQTNSPSWMSNIGQGVGIAGSLMGMFSDRRLKTDIAKVGKLNDGQNVYSYRYKGDAIPRIGLMADEVEKRKPEAVIEHPSGFKMVDYGKATRGSHVGKLLEAA